MRNQHIILVTGCILACQIYVHNADMKLTASPTRVINQTPSLSSSAGNIMSTTIQLEYTSLSKHSHSSDDIRLTPSFRDIQLDKTASVTAAPLAATNRVHIASTSNNAKTSNTIMLYTSEIGTSSAVTSRLPNDFSSTVKDIYTQPVSEYSFMSTMPSPVHTHASPVVIQHIDSDNISVALIGITEMFAGSATTVVLTKLATSPAQIPDITTPSGPMPTLTVTSHTSGRSTIQAHTRPGTIHTLGFTTAPTRRTAGSDTASTSSSISESVTEPSSSSMSFDKELAIIFGSAGGLMVVILVACVIRKKRKQLMSDRFVIGGGDIRIELSRF